MTRKLSLAAVALALLGSTGCCRMADRWCNNHPQPQAVAAAPQCCVPAPQACYPAPVAAPQACYPAPQACYPAPAQGFQRPYGP